jgi:hypothetical protein
MNLKDYYVNRIIDFIRKESPTIYKLFTPLELRDRIRKHMEFNTIVVIWDKEDIAGASIFNINGEECEVHHAIVGSKYRYKDILKQMVRQGFLRYTYVKYIVFRREMKYDSKFRTIPIDRFLQGA